MNRFFSSVFFSSAVIFAGVMAPSVAGAFQRLDTTHHVLISTVVRIDSMTRLTTWQAKAYLSPAQKKMESAIRELIQQNSQPVSLTAPSGFTSWARIDAQHRVYVYLRASKGYSSSEIVTRLDTSSLHLAPVSFFPNCPLVSVWINIKDLGTVAAFPEVGSIRLVTRPLIQSGPIATKGDTITMANQIRGHNPNAWGKGVTVGVLSDDCGSRPEEGLIKPRETNDELPIAANVDVSLDTYEGTDPPRTHEGLAMMEIIHDIAPKAELRFAEGISNITDLCTNIGRLAMNCKVICDDITFLEEPYFEDGDVANTIDSVVNSKADVVYITSAGNFANDVHSFTYHQLSTQLSLSDGGPSALYNVYDFGGGQPYDLVYVPAGATIDVRLQWNDPFTQPTHQYNLFLIDDATKQILYRTSSTDEALQTIIQTNTTGQGHYYDVVVESEQNVVQSPAPRMTLVVHSTNRMLSAQYKNGVSSILGHAMAKDVITCGAVSAMGQTYGVREIYSSRGPNILTDGSTRDKPDVASLDQVATSVLGFSCFGGTSAAAAHVAGLAAMVRSASPSLTASQVRAAILFGANPSPLDPGGFVGGHFIRARIGAGITNAYRTVPYN
ncbi:MAG TPA: S8 family serine peptidase [Candidatus Kapabacteria bacterium]|nr:S8 family serine peptidase [Candidatus Kapabacteria bacterium]